MPNRSYGGLLKLTSRKCMKPKTQQKCFENEVGARLNREDHIRYNQAEARYHSA